MLNRRDQPWLYARLPVPPLLVTEFLHRMADIFKEYFHELSETSLKENFVTVYEVRALTPSLGEGSGQFDQLGCIARVLLPRVSSYWRK